MNPAATERKRHAAVCPDPAAEGVPVISAPPSETPPERSGPERRSQYDRRRGPGRRRTDYRRDAEEGHMNEEQLEFIKALDEYKRVNNRPFPTWTEVLDMVLYLGYRKVAPVGEFKLSKGRQHPRKDRPRE
jgi:hypothetical protein